MRNINTLQVLSKTNRSGQAFRFIWWRSRGDGNMITLTTCHQSFCDDCLRKRCTGYHQRRPTITLSKLYGVVPSVGNDVAERVERVPVITGRDYGRNPHLAEAAKSGMHTQNYYRRPGQSGTHNPIRRTNDSAQSVKRLCRIIGFGDSVRQTNTVRKGNARFAVQGSPPTASMSHRDLALTVFSAGTDWNFLIMLWLLSLTNRSSVSSRPITKRSLRAAPRFRCRNRMKLALRLSQTPLRTQW